MESLYNNPDWTFIINSIFFFLAMLSILLTVKVSFEREVDLITWDASTTAEDSTTEAVSNLQLHNLTLVFQNLGKNVIYESDIVDNIIISINNLEKFDKVFFESNCKFNKINYEIKGSSILFNFDFFESSKYIRTNIQYYSDKPIDVKVNGKIIGGNEINMNINKDTTWEKSYRIGQKDANAKLFVFPFVTLCLIMLLFQLYIRMFSINPDVLLKQILKFNKESAVTIMIGLISILLCGLLGRQITRFFIPFASFMKKEKNWYPKNNIS